MFGGMENMSTFAAFTARTITYLKQSGKFFIVCGVPCISNGATNPHGLLDCSSDLFLPERGEVALSAFNNLYFSFMARTMETARNVKNSTVLCTPTVAKHRPSYKAKFQTEKDLKNQAYHFILSMGLLNEFRGFCANKSGNPHNDCVKELIKRI